jgi:hypothetical protein
MREDVEIMAGNAMTYNRKGSAVYKDAQQLLLLFDEYAEVVPYLNTVSTEAKRILTEISKKFKPETLASVQEKGQPSWKTIQERIKSKNYTSLPEFEGDLFALLQWLRKAAKQDAEKLEEVEEIEVIGFN